MLINVASSLDGRLLKPAPLLAFFPHFLARPPPPRYTPPLAKPPPFEDQDSMAIERTFSIVKPDGVKKNVIGEVLRRFEKAGLRVIAARMLTLSQTQAEGFYGVHRERPFFKDLVKYMTSGPVLIQVLEGEGAVLKNRDLMGATDPKKATAGTIRADLASSIEENVVHGSDSPENAAIEIAYFFAGSDLYPR
jgi:nucleoside-diphosphate kinase